MSNARLVQYAQYGIIPDDIKYYADSMLEACPLCDQPHHNYMLHSFDIPGDGWTDSETVEAFICNSCHFELELLRQHGIHTPAVDIPDTLKTYCMDGTFPPKAQAFVELHHLCVFCRTDIGNIYHTLELPVGDNFVGGQVSVCETCAEAYNWEAKTQILDTCRKSGDYYPITQNEYIARQKQGTKNQHLSPKQSFLEHGNFTPEARFRTTQCEVCAGSILADLTLHTIESLKTPRCTEHQSHVHVGRPEKYGLQVIYDENYRNFRAVITDKVTVITVSYEVEDPQFEYFYVPLDVDHIMPGTIKPAEILFKSYNKLDRIINENKQYHLI